jgi:hypothetical protein
MKRFHLTFGLLAALAGLSLQAQNMILQGNVPFDFRLGETLMPAGDYQFKSTGPLLVAQEYQGRAAALMLTKAASRTVAPEAPVLVFHRYGDDYFFAGIWTPYSADGREVQPTAREKELAYRTSPSSTTVAAVQRK